ncbi:hypothetical protein NPIL_673731 [Nephila pilipes]|uniref:Uncharacterized protein n=1 Tax=Nephila pilipes TaxID=299642 RepID=A0A8X6MZ69_NEPPI|nr:hypothetical protein NPIL_673731 [Nephila pilipes]
MSQKLRKRSKEKGFVQGGKKWKNARCPHLRMCAPGARDGMMRVTSAIASISARNFSTRSVGIKKTKKFIAKIRIAFTQHASGYFKSEKEKLRPE